MNNGTGIDWTDYHLQFGFGTGSGFVPSGPGDGLDFDAPDFNSPPAIAPFTTVAWTQDDMDMAGGIFPAGSFNVFAFTVDVPDGISTFTVRQFPTIPEPSTSALFLLGAIGLGLPRRRNAGCL